MKKTLNINLGGTVFHIDEDAFARLESYLNSLQNQLAQTPGKSEIISDVELRMAELFQEKRSGPEGVISLSMVEEVISVMGHPEDYLDDAARETSPGAAAEAGNYSPSKKLFRDPDSRILGGVASGLAHYFGIDVIWLRLLFLVLLFTGGLSIFIYFILWLAVPKAHTTTDRLRMQGQPVNLSTIEMGRPAPSRSHSTLGHFLSRLGQVLGTIFRFLLKFIGVLLLIGIGLGLLSLIFGGLFYSGHFLQDLPLREGFGFLLRDEEMANVITIGLLLVSVPLLIFILHFAIQLITQSSALHPNTRNGMLILMAVGLAMTTYSGIQIGREFDEDNGYTQRLPLDSATQYHVLSLPWDTLSEELEEDDGVRHLHLFSDSLLAVQGVDFDIRRSPRNYSYLASEVTSQGPTEKQALHYARAVNYPFTYARDTLTFRNYYLLPRGSRFRGQDLDLTLYLRLGDTVLIEGGMEAILDDVDNVHDTWDWDMGGYQWTMKPEGLTCLDCPADVKRTDPAERLEGELEARTEELHRRKEALQNLDIKLEGLGELSQLEALKELEKLKALGRLEDTTLQEIRIKVDGDQIRIWQR